MYISKYINWWIENIPEGYSQILRSFSAIQSMIPQSTECIGHPEIMWSLLLIKVYCHLLWPLTNSILQGFSSTLLFPSWQVMISKDLLDIICIMKVQSLLSGTIDCIFIWGLKVILCHGYLEGQQRWYMLPISFLW